MDFVKMERPNMFSDPDVFDPQLDFIDERFDKITVEDIEDYFDLLSDEYNPEDLEDLKEEMLEDMWRSHLLSIEDDKLREVELCLETSFF